MLENQSADSHISEVGIEQTVDDSHIETVGEQIGEQGDSHISEPAAEEQSLEKEIDDIWGFDLPQDDDLSRSEPEGPETEEEETAEEDTPEEETDEVEEPTENPGVEEATDQETITLNFLGQKIDVPPDEAKNLAERGLNADRIQAKYERLKPLEGVLETAETAAYLYDMPVEQVISSLVNLDGIRNGEVQRLVEQGNTEQAAIELFNAKLEAAKAKREKAGTTNKGLTQEQKAQVKAFQTAFPDVDKKISEGMEIPKEVLDQWKAGATLTEAWLSHERAQVQSENKNLQKQIKDLEKQKKQLEKDVKNLKKNTENKTKAPSSKKGTGGGSGHDNPFSGWDKF